MLKIHYYLSLYKPKYTCILKYKKRYNDKCKKMNFVCPDDYVE